jgi:uncharacterized protein YlxW (UPF0749 family)
MTREISIEAIALRADRKAKLAENDALLLQDDLLNAQKQIKQLTAELNNANLRLAEIEAQNGTPS